MRSLFKNMSEHSMKLLSLDILTPSRQKRSAKSCQKAGVVLKKANVEGSNRADRETLQGIILRGKEAPYSVDGKEFFIDEATWVIGEIKVGAICTISTTLNASGERYAVKVMVK